MTKHNKAFVVGGWSESEAFLWGLTNEISAGTHSIVDEAETITLAMALRNKEKFDKEARSRLVITHSAGMMAVHNAGMIVALNAPEPTPLRRAVQGVIRTTKPNVEPEAALVKQTGLSDGLGELARHPSLVVAVPARLRTFSTVQTLIEGETAFPGGRAYLPAEHDEFGFGSQGEVERAQEHGIVARMLPGYHNQTLLRPQEGAQYVQWALEQLAA